MIRILFLMIFLAFILPIHVYAKSGCCSSHDGVNCSAGPQSNGKVICNDGNTGSSCLYSEMVMCNGTSTTNSVSLDESSSYTQLPTSKPKVEATPLPTLKPTPLVTPVAASIVIATSSPTIEPTMLPKQSPSVMGEVSPSVSPIQPSSNVQSENVGESLGTFGGLGFLGYLGYKGMRKLFQRKTDINS